MLNLLKYEFLRRKRLLVSILLILVFLEIATYVGILLGGNWYLMSIVFMFIIFIGGLIFPFIDVVTNHYSDFKNKNGYMLYLTPSSGGKIIGSKAIFALSEIIVMIMILIGAVVLNVGLLQRLFPNEVTSILSEMSTELQMVFNVDKLTFWTISPMIFVAIIQYFTNMMLAILAITIAKTVLSNKDFNWLFALLFYFGISIVTQFANTGVISAFGFVGDIIKVANTNSETFPNLIKYLSVGAGMYIIWSFASIFISSKLLSKRTDL